MAPRDRTSQRRHQPGARESNAGDDFHVLWAMGQALQMLDPRSTLQRVVVEGMSPRDELASDPGALLGVDLTEYHGAPAFTDADAVIVSQLKYSHRNPSEAWTSSRLARRGSRGQPGVISRLAEIYGEFKAQHGREMVAAKLRIRIVSNQPAHSSLTGLLRKVQDRLHTQPRIRAATLRRDMSVREQADLQKLHDATGLGWQDFTSFIALLSIEGLNAGSRSVQRTSIAETIGAHVIGGISAQMNALYMRFLSEALPEAAGSPGVTRADLLAELGAANTRSLFPVPPHIVTVADPLPTQDAESLGAAVLAGNGHIVGHGVAGVGKTTTVTQLQEVLPEGSTVIHYDCFGAGEYLNPDQARHAPKQALTQLINMIAINCGTPLLVGSDDTVALWQHYRAVLEQAVHGLAADAHLVVAIDAADNACVAGQIRGELTFVPDLWRIHLPSRVHLLMTARTHRVEMLEPPAQAHHVALTGFDEATSALHLRRAFAATDDEAREFHRRSEGNPRTQFYVLDPTRPDGPTDAAAAIDIAAATPDLIFADLLRAATTEAQSPAKARSQLADLICLTRSVSVQTFATVTGRPIEETRRFVAGLAPGLTAQDDVISFRDEDFETHIRQSVSEEDQTKAHRRIASTLMPLRHIEEYAASACAEHLYHGGHHADLVKLALDEPAPAVIVDPISRTHTYRRRLELAMKVASGEENRRSAIPLVLQAAAAAATDEAVRSVIRKRPDLAVRFADSESVAAVFEADTTGRWQGVQHMRLAGLHGQGGRLELAGEELDMVDAWLRKRQEAEPHERSGWDFDAGDLAAAYRAVHALHGPERVARSLSGWRPLTFAMEVAEALTRDLARDEVLDVERDIIGIALASWAKARLLVCAAEAGHEVTSDQVRQIAQRTLERPSTRISPAATVTFAELIARTTRDTDLVTRWLEANVIATPSFGPSRTLGLRDWEPIVRAKALRAAIEARPLTVEEIVPSRWRDEESWSDEERRRLPKDKRALEEALRAEMPMLETRARTILGIETYSGLKARLTEGTSAISRRYRDDQDGRHSRWLSLAMESTLAMKGPIRPLITSLHEAARELDGSDGHWATIRIADLALRDRRTRALALTWIDGVAAATRAAAEPASERIERLLTVTQLALPHDEAAAEAYYLAAIEAADDLDDEGSGILRVLAAFAAGCHHADATVRRDAGLALVAATERFRPRVSDERYLRFDTILGAVSGLDPAVGTMTLVRWDALNHIRFGDSVSFVIRAAADCGFFAPIEAAELGYLGGPAEVRSREMLRRLGDALDVRPRAVGAERRRILRAVDRFANFVTEEASPSARLRISQELAEWSAGRSLRSSALDQVTSLAAFAQTLSRERPTDPAPFPPRERVAEGRRLLRRAKSASLRSFPALLEKFLASWPDEHQITQFLDDAAERRQPDERVAFLEVLADLPPRTSLWGYQSRLLLRCLGKWKRRWQRPDIQSWFANRLPAVLADRFESVLPYDQADDDTLHVLIDEGLVDDPGSLILQATGPIIESLTAGNLYAIARALGHCSADEDRVHALQWSLDEETRVPEPTGGTSRGEVTAQLLWTMFGHPERSIRWCAAHTARHLLKNDPDVFDTLISLARGRHAPSGLPDGFEFLWLSAVQWTLLVVARLADEEASSISEPALRWLVETGTSKELPHSSIRELARRTALQLHSQGRTLPPAEVEELQWIHEAKAVHTAPWHSIPSDRFEARRGERFTFNSMDTIPYWFEPLGRVFVQRGSEIARRAERWIVDELGFTDDAARAGRTAALGRYDWTELQNNHGAQPRVEDLRTYLEYHGMLLAAGELLDEGTAIERDSWDEERDSWQQWLAENVDSSPNRWVRDLRTAAPTEPWVYDQIPSPHRWREVTDADFDHALDIRDGHIVVSASVDVHGSKRWATTWVSSALVSPRTARSLLRALQSAEDPSDFRLPEETRPGYGDDMEIDEPGFRLEGWIRESNREELGLEEHDPYRRVRALVALPGKRYQQVTRARPDHTGRCLLRGRTLLAWQNAWDDQERERHDIEAHSSGRRTYVQIDPMCDFLETVERKLVIEVQLRRHFSRDDHTDEDGSYDRGQSRIYLLDSSGRLETLAGRRQIGGRDRAAARAGAIR